MEKLTYKDFKIGQKVICVQVDNFYEQHLTVGKSYEIEDLEFRFPDKICVKSDISKISMFMPIKLFNDIKYTRKLKLQKIKNESSL